ncbi:unnamed protein product [Larinioides sclopetarius]|uniref:Uncharacterized protein n=1 Tax=Larinioides sclopetarius TaxID=280406 RepID=A0AAV2B1M9_9ARAC
MDKRRNLTSQTGDKELIDVLEAELAVDSEGAVSNQDPETSTGSERLLLAARQFKEKDAGDDEKELIPLRELNAKLKQQNEWCKKVIKQRKAEISRMSAETDALRSLRETVFKTNESEADKVSDLEKVVEGYATGWIA